MTMIARAYLFVLSVAIAAVPAVLAFAAISIVAMGIPWVSGIVGLAVFILVLRALLQAWHRGGQPSGLVVSALALAGALACGTLMLAGTWLLGHVRPTWMEFGYAPGAAGVGAVLGMLAGLAQMAVHRHR